MKAGAGCEDLRVRCPHYYSVATRLHAAMQASLTADEGFPAFILNTFRSRYKVGGRAGALQGRCCGSCACKVGCWSKLRGAGLLGGCLGGISQGVHARVHA